MDLNVRHLEEVARARDSDRRRELLGTISELFLSGNSEKSGREQALFSDIFLRTVDELDFDGRKDVAEQLAESAKTPRDVALRLARAEAEVADPILRQSPVLEDRDLIELAQSMSNDHLVSISRRDTLSEGVTDVLIDRGDTSVMRQVASNDGARISAGGFRTLAEKAGDDEIVQQNLAERMDVPESTLKRILPKVSNDVAVRLKTAFANATDKRAMNEALSRAEKMFASAKLDSSKARVSAMVVAKEIASEKRHIDDVFEGYAADDRFMELAIIASKLADLPEGLVTNLMFKTENAPFVIICRSIGLKRRGFLAISDLRCRRLKLPSSHGNHAVAEFDAIDERLAKRLVRFVNLRMTV